MLNLSLKFYPEPCLQKACWTCHRSIEEVKEIGEEMIRIMFENDGYGLSAPQVGLTERLFVMRDPTDRTKGIIIVNPIIIARQGIWVENEGCLSLPGVRVKISRATRIDIDFDGPEDRRTTQHVEGWDARCIQHEIDHLDGIIIFDHIKSNLGKRLFLDKYYKKRRKYDRING